MVCAAGAAVGTGTDAGGVVAAGAAGAVVRAAGAAVGTGGNPEGTVLFIDYSIAKSYYGSMTIE
ncbi:MAG: hypothetical protein EAZ74_01395 [Alphaproteobacteria bacterium]|nr:MAG: hypothetical protein EAY76_04930 [Alphaproteobacteria bacterium]TAF15579.1 MAG: hypothetical protein EAZ74_01395 [Alphaproteobacteria bacterium]TAF41983.1 MAG: hypothetical protein EAZ66_00140 [Alphaproteobacteria bacterium]TAF76591.1 MAG: hypothetical protein EAZ52_03435 [Alphaproteobacteria bacterium]